MDNPALASVRDKIRRAQFHLDTINAALTLTLGTTPESETFTIDTDPEGTQWIARFRKIDPLDPSLPLIIGDCIHNLRSALDHLVYQLAVLNGSSASAAEKTAFPICLRETGPNGFNDRVRTSLKPFVSAAALAEIENSQPYRAYSVPNEADIWVLHKLDIIDKHRLLLVARDQFLVRQFWFTATGKEPEQVILPDPKWKPMEEGAEIIRFRAVGGVPYEVKFEAKIEAVRTVQFVNTGLACDLLPVGDVINQVMGITKATVRDFGRNFFGE
jgi:hypothetical protein